jgi:dipeptidyl aminopeptidase/acylaminoacyl peptidase
MRYFAVPCALIALLSFSPPLSADDAAPSPLQMQDLLSAVHLSVVPGTPTVISPDGRRVAYTTSSAAASSNVFDPRGAGRKQLWVISSDGSQALRIGSSMADNWAPAWSPNDRYLAFYSGVANTGRLCLWDSRNGVVRALDVAVRINAPVAQWLPDSQRMIVSVMHPVEADAGKDGQILKPTLPSSMTVLQSVPGAPAQRRNLGDTISLVPYNVGARPVDVSLVNAETGSMTVLAPNVKPTTVVVSPDAKKLLYTVDSGIVSNDVNSRVIFDVYVVDLADRSLTTIAKNILTAYTASSVGWSHDDSLVSFIGGVLPNDSALIPGYGAAFPGHAYVVDVRHPGSPHRLGSALLERTQSPLLWSDDNRTLYGGDMTYGTSSISRKILKIGRAYGTSKVFYALRGGSFQMYPGEAFFNAGTHRYIRATGASGAQDVYDVNFSSGKTIRVYHGYQKINALTFSQDGSSAAYVGESASRPADVWLATDDFAQREQITHLNPQISQRALGEAEDVSWRAEGQLFSGTLLLPAGYVQGKRYPLITEVYAGEDTGSNDRNIFGMSKLDDQALYYNMQLYASRGYVVFIPNSLLRIGMPMHDIARVILPGVDKIIAMGIADPNRLGVIGQSYGGYSAMALIVQTSRFKAAVETAGIVDLISMYGTLYPNGSDWTAFSESEQGRMGGTPWQYRNRYIENSPFFFLDRVRTPVLLEYGTADTPAAVQAGEAFVGLRRLGKEATLIGYVGEGHVVLGSANQIDLWQRIVTWFDQHLHR